MTWAALILWPFVAAVLFKTLRMPVALLVTIIGGYLLLPTQVHYDLPVLPSLNKSSIPALIALVCVFVLTNQPKTRATAQAAPDWPVQPGFLPRSPFALTMLVILFAGIIGTHMTNGDTLVYGPRYLRALGLWDTLSAGLEMLMLILPFFLARKVLATREGQVLLLKTLVIAATAYAFLALYEVRMSPQINRMVYGFFPHDWTQHIRAGGWRPVVFLNHGLLLGIFFAVATIAAACLVRITEAKERLIWLLLMFWLLATLVLAKVLGAQMITLMMLGVVFFLPRHVQIWIAGGIVIAFLLYPILRVTNLLPFDLILSSVGDHRAYSFQVRLNNEQMLLEKANERPLFGWGGWGRNRIYTDMGHDISITDGGWVIRLGAGGWIGYIGFFGLMSWGVLSLMWRRHSTDIVSIALALCLTVLIADLVPNDNNSPIIWLVAGSLVGRLEMARRDGQDRVETPAATPTEPDPGIRYARDDAPMVVSRPTATASSRRSSVPYRRKLGKAET